MTRLGLLAAVLALALAASACAEPPTPVYTSANQNIEAGAGQRFIISLESNPTTGYNWELTPDNSGTYQLLGKEYTQDPASKGLVGAGGTQTFTFQGVKAGKGSIRLTYRRSWMPPDQPGDKVLTFTITVK